MLVGTNPNSLLPDIHISDNSLGFEVVRCVCEKESEIERDAKLVDKYYNEKEHREKTLENIKKNIQPKIFYFDMVSGNVTMRYKPTVLSNDWILSVFKKELKRKLEKLNNGNYSNCKNVSLIVLNVSDITTDFNFDLILNVYKNTSKEFKQNFIDFYFITRTQIYYINKKDMEEEKKLLNDEFYILTNKMKHY